MQGRIIADDLKEGIIVDMEGLGGSILLAYTGWKEDLSAMSQTARRSIPVVHTLVRLNCDGGGTTSRLSKLLGSISNAVSGTL